MEGKREVLIIMIVVCLSLVRIDAQVVKDIEGNVYLTTQIGTQVWMAENLKTTKFNDGTEIPFVEKDKSWKELKTPAYCWFRYNIENKEIYGALYNWYAVNTKKLCPDGWHVPEDREWIVLNAFLGDPEVAGNKLKENGMKHWKNSATYSPDDLGFTALPGGMRIFSGIFPDFAESYAVWWSSTEIDKTEAWSRGLQDISTRFWRGPNDKRNGYSIRCIKD
jgi:uncharacterized protein (TIGR02145 family)